MKGIIRIWDRVRGLVLNLTIEKSKTTCLQIFFSLEFPLLRKPVFPKDCMHQFQELPFVHTFYLRINSLGPVVPQRGKVRLFQGMLVLILEIHPCGSLNEQTPLVG